MFINRLLIQCPSTLKTSLGVPDKDFELVGLDNYLKLWVERANYKEAKTYKDGGNQYLRSFATPIVKLKAYIREMEVKVADEHAVLYDLVQAIAHFLNLDAVTFDDCLVGLQREQVELLRRQKRERQATAA